MDFLHTKYDALRTFIKQQYGLRNDWEEIKKYALPNTAHAIALPTVALIVALSKEELTVELWENMVTFLQKKDEKNKVTNLGQYTRNDAKIANDPSSAWQLYKKRLIEQNLSESSIENIEKASYELLRRLSTDTTDTEPVKGLVIGNVQSGKTANMAGLMAMAADNGFNYFIVLSGVIESLRKQTEKRLYNDLHGAGEGNLNWTLIENPSLRTQTTNPTHNISSFRLGETDRTRYFSVCLKNSTRLQQLKKWLYSDENKAKQLKILIIDDEADQASINTNNIEEEDPTKISKCIQELVNTDKVKAMNYIAYTATPYANVLNETGKQSLYPKDFISLLNPSEDYIGAKEIFGTELPETVPYIDIVREIPLRDGQIVQEIQKGETDGNLPQSFKQSIQWFLLCVAAMRAIDYSKPISMLVHTSFKIDHHQIIAKKITEYLEEIRHNYSTVIEEMKALYEDESLDFKRSYFLQGMENYSAKETVPDYPSWQEVERYIERMMRLPDEQYVSHIPIDKEGQPEYHKGIHLVIDNSRATAENQIVRLVYPTKQQNVAPAFIVVGGNTLSRGLTLEGLTTTYFLRTTNQADTLMQMARWFGYRKGYEIFPRIWLDRLALERFQFLSQMNEELREEILIYAEKGLTPLHYAPRIKNSPNRQLIRITSSNKMQSAVASEYNFAGFNSQTIYFENDVAKLKHNLQITKQFLNNLASPEIKTNRLIWRGVASNCVKEFLQRYEVCSSDIKMSSLPALIDWVEDNAENMADWNIIYSAVGDLEKARATDEEWNIHGYSPQASKRTKIKNRSSEQIANIGALRSPADLLADIDAELDQEEKSASKASDVEQIREKYGYGLVPQIIIYKIDKGEMSEEEYLQKHIERAKENGNEVDEKYLKRAPLNFAADAIGINIMIPGTSRGDVTTSVSALLCKDNTQIDESDFEEESEV